MKHKDFITFVSYDSCWERTFFDEITGGFLVTQLARKYKPMSKNDRETFRKEQEMGIKFASFGFQIEHLNEIPGQSSPDASIRRHGTTIRVNGKTADFKRLTSDNNIYREGKDARYKKKADLVMFEFTGRFGGIQRALYKLSLIGIRGYYYYTGGKRYYSFDNKTPRE